MSSFINIPKRILTKLYELEKKWVTYPFADKIRRQKLKFADYVENRELIVVDKSELFTLEFNVLKNFRLSFLEKIGVVVSILL